MNIDLVVYTETARLTPEQWEAVKAIELARRRRRALIVRWSPANPYWWGWHRAMWAHQVLERGVRY